MAEDKDKTPKGDINFESNVANGGMNMDSTPNQVEKGKLTYALNAALENFDANSINYQNEPGTEFCVSFPDNYQLIGRHFIPEQTKYIFFLANPITGDSEIGYMINNDCIYHTYVNAKCLNFDVNFPIHKSVHKTGNCGTELYWAQPNADRRYINLDATEIPRLPFPDSTPCDQHLTDLVDCNQLRVQPSYSIPLLTVKNVLIGGNLIAGVYQFAFQYSDALGSPLSSYQSVTNPTPIADPQFATVNFNYPVGKSIVLNINNIETGGQFEFFNIAVIKTINNITSVELIGTYGIEGDSREITYSGQNVSQIRLTVNDIFEKFPFYGPADDVTTVQDVLVWKGLSAPQRISYQKIASQITLLWETWRIPPTENYSDEWNATHLRGYLRDEIYPFELVFLLRSGKQTDGFHIPGRALTSGENSLPMIDPSNDDYIEDPELGPLPYWRIYNTATNLGNVPGYTGLGDVNYKGPYQYGTFAYWESDATYPCDEEMWGDLASQPIRHHKFPDVEISPIIESKIFDGNKDNLEMGNVAVFPIGVRVDPAQIRSLINTSDLTPEQKLDIVGFKIVRGDRTDNKSIVAKGMLRNVGKYSREDEDYYYANYPYNDLGEDPFLNAANNAWTQLCEPYNINVVKFNGPPEAAVKTELIIEYTDCNTNKTTIIPYRILGPQPILCSTSKPILRGAGTVNKMNQSNNGPSPGPDTNVVISLANYDIWVIEFEGGTNFTAGERASWNDLYDGPITDYFIDGFLGNPDDQKVIVHVIKETVPVEQGCDPNSEEFEEGNCDLEIGKIEEVRNTKCKDEVPLPTILEQPDLRYRQIFNSPETSFGQPFLGDVLKLESVMFGMGLAHFVEVKDNAKYRLLTEEAQRDALSSSQDIADDEPNALFAAYQAYLQIYINGITRKNYAYSFNSIADYNYTVPVPNGVEKKQRRLDLKRYLIPAIQNIGEEDIDINNYQRETSVYLKTTGSDDGDPTPLPYPHESPNMGGATPILIEDSRFTISEKDNCATPAEKEQIEVVSYYASLKNTFRNQWGQIYTYQTIDTGFQYDFDLVTTPPQPTTVFGGDTFITRFAFKIKLPFFIDNRVGAPDDSDIFYDELGNIAYPKYWHSARSILENASSPATGDLMNFISYKAHNFDCPNSQEPPPPANNPNRTFYDGYFYLFAYGIPNFYVETSYNVDLRQAFNNMEGDFWPHVSNSIPDDWLQESFVTIAQDNTYYYNVSFSKQNKETFFSHLPANWQFEDCEFIYPFRVIYSDPQIATTDTTVNNWLTYRASNYFDFPQHYGKLTSIDGIEKGQLLARFENKSLLYNALYTTQTNTNGQVYLGQPLFTRQPPPFDYAETDLGYIGSQHKFILKIPQGQITIDAKRGQVFLIRGHELKDLSLPGSGMNRFFTDHLSFEIAKYFPDVNIDNHFNGLGLHGVYDSKFDRVIITKLDYLPLDERIKFDPDSKEFYIEEVIPQNTVSVTPLPTIVPETTTTSTTKSITIRTRVMLSDPDYFCNKSWTLSYNFITESWISFHSYLPNWYLGENNFFYSGTKACCANGFDFTFLVGELVPDPSTTTSTSSSTTSTSSTTTTTTTLSCTLDGGIEIINCELAGTGVITVIPAPPPCARPINLPSYSLNRGYEVLVPPSAEVISSGSFIEACDAKAFVFASIPNIVVISNTIETASLTVGSIVYLGANLTSCDTIPDGYYFTNNSAQGIYQVLNGKIESITPCSGTTTTTTTCVLYLYDVEFYLCGSCTVTGPGTIGNSQVLVEDKYYFDSEVTGFKFKVLCPKGCGTGTDRNVPSSSAQDNCPAVMCTTTTSSTTVALTTTTSTT